MEKVDFVVTWVDASDKQWRETKNKYSTAADTQMNSESRYRNWDFFKYWFRAVEQNAPWVNKIYVVTEGHIPQWLNTEHQKLEHIKHSDYIEQENLPTFNSNVIELNLNKIETLSENFVLFNDDTFLNRVVSPEDFFKNGLPKDIGVFSPIVPKREGIASIVLNCVSIIDSYFNASDVLRNNFSKFYRVGYRKHLIKNFCVLPWKNILGFYDHHLPVSYLKSNFDLLWSLENNAFTETSTHRFRQKTDISHYLIRYWQLCKGEFVPRNINFGEYYDVEGDFDRILEDIDKGIHALICINDGENVVNFEENKKQLLAKFEERYPNKSVFER